MKIPKDLRAKLTPIVDIYLPREKYQSALDSLTELKDKFPNFHVIDYYLGVSYMNLADVDGALKHLMPLSTSNQLTVIQLVQTNMIQGLIFTDAEEYDRAEIVFKNAIKVNPQSSMSYSALGYVYYLTKRYDEAIRYFKLAIKEDPNNASAHNNLCFTFAEIGVNISEAQVEGRKAVALNPNSAAYHDSLGWAHFMAQDYPSALSQLNKAFELYPNHPVILDHLEKAKKKVKLQSKRKKK